MAEEYDELDDFNDRVGGASSSGGTRARSPSTPDPCGEDEDNLKEAKDARMWAVQGHNFFPCDEAVKTLPPGQYEVQHSQSSGYFFQRKMANFDELMRLPDSASEEMYQNIETFWTKEEHFRSFGFLWKRGILLWGPAGSGKTSTLQLISQSIIDKGGLSIYVNHPAITAQGLEIYRRIEPNRPCVVMLEDLDAMISNHGEHEVLALLDGELQIDNVVFIATTNYPERLDKRIVNRPSRFDIVKLIGMPNAAAREMYLGKKNKRLLTSTLPCKHCTGTAVTEVIVTRAVAEVPAIPEIPAIEEIRNEAGEITTEAVKAVAAVAAVPKVPPVMGEKPCGFCEGKGNTPEIDEWVKESDQFSIAHLKELIVSVEVFEVSLAHAIKRLKKMMDHPPKSTDPSTEKIGQYS
jgi:hypothetical protein